MAGSMGSVMMNWTSVLVKQSKKKNRRKMKEQHRRQLELEQLQEEQLAAAQQKEKRIEEASEVSCVDCAVNRERVSSLESDLAEAQTEAEGVGQRLEAAKGALATIIDREGKLREDHDRVTMDLAQSRHDLRELQTELDSQDREREQQVTALERALGEKEQVWRERQDQMQRELNRMMHHSYQVRNIADMDRGQLEQVRRTKRRNRRFNASPAD